MNEQSNVKSQRSLSAPGEGLLWLELLIGPIAWFLHMQISYSLVLWVCKHGHESVLHLTTVLFLILTLSGVLLSNSSWHSATENSPGAGDEPIAARAKFMAALGIMSSVLFTLVIIAQGIASFIISPCQN